MKNKMGKCVVLKNHVGKLLIGKNHSNQKHHQLEVQALPSLSLFQSLFFSLSISFLKDFNLSFNLALSLSLFLFENFIYYNKKNIMIMIWSPCTSFNTWHTVYLQWKNEKIWRYDPKTRVLKNTTNIQGSKKCLTKTRKVNTFWRLLKYNHCWVK